MGLRRLIRGDCLNFEFKKSNLSCLITLFSSVPYFMVLLILVFELTATNLNTLVDVVADGRFVNDQCF